MAVAFTSGADLSQRIEFKMFAVVHKEYGEGYAICFREKGDKTFIVVDFGEDKREFAFPDDFSDKLVAKDEEIQKDILSEIK